MQRKTNTGEKNKQLMRHIQPIFIEHPLYVKYCQHFSTLAHFGLGNYLFRVVRVGNCPMHCRMFNSISGFYPLDASSTPSSHDKMSPDIAKCPLEGKISPGEKHWLGDGGTGRKQPTQPQCVLEEGLAGPADDLTGYEG